MATNQLAEAYAVEAFGASGAAQQNVATIPAVSGRTACLKGFEITGGGGIAGIIEITVAGLLGGTVKYETNVLGTATGPMNAQGGFFKDFPDLLPASAVNTAITITVPSFGSTNTNASVIAYGCYK